VRKIKIRDKEKRPAFPPVAAFCLILLFFPSITGASSITLEYRLGFNGLFTLNKWTPVTVIIENKGKTINGHLEIIATSGSEFRRDVYNRTYSTPVELPTHSKSSIT
jgi:hypothetical protein